jgi:uncharacterized protein (DUF983 family)
MLKEDIMPENVKVGSVRKCPSCGESVNSFQTRCSSCGHEFNNIQTSETVQAFFQRLEAQSNLEYKANKEREMRELNKQNAPQKKVGFGTVLLWLFFFWILWVPIIFKKAKGPYATAMAAFGVVAIFSLLMIYAHLNPAPIQNTTVNSEQTSDETEQSTTQSGKELPFPVIIGIFTISIIGMGVVFIIMKPKWTPEDERRKSMIEMFPIPNSREDLTEFIILGTGQIKPVNPIARLFSLQVKRQVGWNDIWISKCKQVYTKARIAMKDDSSSLNAISQLMTEAGL